MPSKPSRNLGNGRREIPQRNRWRVERGYIASKRTCPQRLAGAPKGSTADGAFSIINMHSVWWKACNLPPNMEGVLKRTVATSLIFVLATIANAEVNRTGTVGGHLV